MFTKQSTTLTDLAKVLKIDDSTVSKELKDHPKISDKTKDELWELTHRSNFHSFNTTALVKGSNNLVGVMVPQTDETFFASAIKGIDDVLKNQGYQSFIFQSHENTENEISNIKTMFRTKVDGIIASHAMTTENFEHYQHVLDQDIPLVLFDRFSDKLDSDVVAIDDYRGAYKAVTHLIEQGCKNIVHITGYQNVHIFKERLRGYKQALNDNGFNYKPDNIFECNMSLDDGKMIASTLLEKNALPDAIICSNDYTALGALQILKQEGITIPDQVAIVGFSNETFTPLVTPGITSVEQHSRKMGEIAARHFLQQISAQRGKTPKGLPKKTILTPELIIRDSSCKK